MSHRSNETQSDFRPTSRPFTVATYCVRAETNKAALKGFAESLILVRKRTLVFGFSSKAFCPAAQIHRMGPLSASSSGFFQAIQLAFQSAGFRRPISHHAASADSDIRPCLSHRRTFQ